MGKQTVYRITGFFLSLTVLCLGCGCTVLLYFAGQKGVDFVYTSQNLFKDAENVIRLRNPSKDWYGEAMLRGWFAGFIYMLPGASGIISSLFYYKCPMIFHLVISIILVFVGSFLHTAGAIAILLYRFLLLGGIYRHNVLLGDCIFVRDAEIPLEYVDDRCMLGRKALIMAIAALSLMLLTWIFIFADILYRAFTYSNIKKFGKTGRKASNSNRSKHQKPSDLQKQLEPRTPLTIQDRDDEAINEADIQPMPGPSNLQAVGTHHSEDITQKKVLAGTVNEGFEAPENDEQYEIPLSKKKKALKKHFSKKVGRAEQDIAMRHDVVVHTEQDREPAPDERKLHAQRILETEKL